MKGLIHLPNSVASRLGHLPSSCPEATGQTKHRLNYENLQPPDAFFGGRTENFVRKWSRQLHRQTFKYVDVCSLYPYVSSRSVQPSGHRDLIMIATEQQPQSFTKEDMARFNKNSASEMPPQTSDVDEVANVLHGRGVEIKWLDRVDRILTISSSDGDIGYKDGFFTLCSLLANVCS